MSITKKDTKRKGPSKEVACRNLEKAREAKRQAKEAERDMSLMMPQDMSEDMVRSSHKETCNRIALSLGRQVSDMLEQTSKKELLKSAYGFKSLSDTYQSYLKLNYPLGLDTRDSSQLSHLLGSILPQLKATLNIDMSAHLSPPPVKRRQVQSRQVIDLNEKQAGDTTYLSTIKDITLSDNP